MNSKPSFYYSKDHEWVSLSDDKKIATIGITHFAQSALGDIVFVEMPKKDSMLSANTVVGTLESVKSVSDIFSPVSGKVIEVNEEVMTSPEIVNQSPEQNGWLFKVELTSTDFSHLMNYEEYQKLTS